MCLLLYPVHPSVWDIHVWLRLAAASNMPSADRFAVHLQAGVLDATDVLVAPHGAMMALLLFLPRRSVIVDVSSEASHRLMNEYAARTLPHLKLQTVSVS